MFVPFVDLKAQYATLRSEIDAAIRSILEKAAFIGGQAVRDFEQAFARKLGVKHCVSCANGTDAIYITLKALGIGPGDEVITVANSWISTSETITQTGARPVFVDIEPDFFHIDPGRIEDKITPRTKAVIPVHLFGQCADIEPLRALCRARGLGLIEDCAQAHFATYRGRPAGTFGLAGTFSFYPGKNLGAYGDAGAIATSDDELAARARLFANHGSIEKHRHEIEGINSRLDGLQAAVLGVKLPHIDAWNEARNAKAKLYDLALAGIPEVVVPKVRPGAFHIFHLYVVRVPRRNELAEALKRSGVETGIHYPTALPFMPAYRHLGHRAGDFPVAHRYQDEILSLPMFPELTEDQIRFVAGEIDKFFAPGRSSN